MTDIAHPDGLALLGGMRAGGVDPRTENAIREGVTGPVRRFPLPY